MCNLTIVLYVNMAILKKYKHHHHHKNLPNLHISLTRLGL